VLLVTRYYPTLTGRGMFFACYCLFTCSVLYGSKTEFSTVHFIYRTVHRHGYEDVTLHTTNIQEQTILPNSPIFIPTSSHNLPRCRRRPPAVGPVGLTCQSLRGRFSRLTFLLRELSTNIYIYSGQSYCSTPIRKHM